MQIASLRQQLIQRFSESDSAALDADCLLCAVLSCTRTYLRTWPEQELTPEQVEQVEQLAVRREQGEPVAYILGVREFWSLPLQVSPATLIPRPDTEALVEWSLTLLSDKGQGQKALDLGTGTGAIALALKSEMPALSVWALEREPAALDLARRNAARLGFSVNFLASNWFSALNERGFQLIVSNPPYIDATDPHLSQGDVRFEPHTALVADDDGLADIRQIIEQAPTYLATGGWLLLEHGWQQAEAVRSLLVARGFHAVTTKQDLGGQDRVSGGQWPGDVAG
ncbi:peptide chain release factor N(5)-glutamine methyltransferase [Tolumonas osonensis]|uniref:Release factor glutamine methyltransferase n=1 Tax=Tolumonas osonensis TaxID=675874 RepID=A0A841GC90_9GAMM|nr:peptide chain release factor N(5)-glutamine methyltransferase [Tolumonas osonensis]MBB6054146.1 release factor glutamine methyltransferase [Tolumonas osonensis]